MAVTVLVIPVWFDARRGHECDNHGRPLKGPLDWYRAHVHSGESRAAVRAQHGCAAERGAVWLYDMLCQLTAASKLSRRGTICDAFGRPLTAVRLAALLEHPAADIAELLAILVEAGWVCEIDEADVAEFFARRARELGGAAAAELCGEAPADGPPDVRQSSADGAPTAHKRRALGAGSSAADRNHNRNSDRNRNCDSDRNRLEPEPAEAARGAATADEPAKLPEQGEREARLLGILRLAGMSARGTREVLESGVSPQRLLQATLRIGAYRRVQRVKSPTGLLLRCLRDGIDHEWVRGHVIGDPPLPAEGAAAS